MIRVMVCGGRSALGSILNPIHEVLSSGCVHGQWQSKLLSGFAPAAFGLEFLLEPEMQTRVAKLTKAKNLQCWDTP